MPCGTDTEKVDMSQQKSNYCPDGLHDAFADVADLVEHGNRYPALHGLGLSMTGAIQRCVGWLCDYDKVKS